MSFSGSTFNRIMAEITRERVRQEEKYSAAHDDTHDELDWAELIEKRLDGPHLFDRYRESMIEVAALAIAAVESHDRLNSRDNPVDNSREDTAHVSDT